MPKLLAISNSRFIVSVTFKYFICIHELKDIYGYETDIKVTQFFNSYRSYIH